MAYHHLANTAFAGAFLGVVALAACGGSPTESRGPAIEDIDVRPDQVAAPPGHRVAMNARVVTSGGAPSSVRWSSSDSGVAAIDSTGERRAYLTVTADTLGARARVRAVSTFDTAWADHGTVESAFACPLWGAGVLPRDTTLTAIGETVHVRARANGCGTDYCGEYEACAVEADSAFRWTSSDTGVASVDSLGVVTAEGPGHATVQAAFLGDPQQAPEAEVRVDTTGS